MQKLLLLNLYILYASGFDSYFYGRGEQGKFKWLFQNITLLGISKPWRYRILQKFIEISGLAAMFFTCGSCGLIACLSAHFFMVLDRLYYVFNKQELNLKVFEINNEDVWWLKNIWFSGKFFFTKDFTVSKFNISAIIGLLISYLTILIF